MLLVHPLDRQQNPTADEWLLPLVPQGILGSFQINDISLGRHLELNVVVDDLEQKNEIFKFEKLQKNFFRVQTQFYLKFVFDAFVDPEAALEISLCFDALKQNEILRVSRVLAPK